MEKKYYPWLDFTTDRQRYNGPYQMQMGGIAISDKDQYEGLNNSKYDQMYFPMQGYNVFRGLDNGKPVQIVDEKGKNKVLRGNKDTDIFFGSVHEQRLQYGGKVDHEEQQENNQDENDWLSQDEQPVSLPSTTRRNYKGRKQTKLDRSVYIPHPAIHRFEQGGLINDWLNNY
jgi:hypothetical protein